MTYRSIRGLAGLSLIILVPSVAMAAAPKVFLAPTVAPESVQTAANIANDVLAAKLGAAKPLNVSLTSLIELSALLEQEQQKDMLGCTDVSCMAEIGAMLDADVLILPRLRKLGDQYVLSVSAVSSKTTEAIGREVLYADANDKALIAAIERLAEVTTYILGWKSPPPDAVDTGKYLSWKAAAKKTGVAKQAVGKQRLIVVLEETIDGKKSVVPQAEAAMRAALQAEGYRLVSKAQADKVRRAASVELMMQGELPAEVSSIDADILIAGQVDSANFGSLADMGVTAYQANIALNAVRLDNAQIVASVATEIRKQSFSATQAARAALKALGGKAAKEVSAHLQAQGSGPSQIDVVIHGLKNRRAISKMKKILARVDQVSDVTSRHSSKKITKLELTSTVSPDDLADILDGDSNVPLEILQTSATVILARYDAARGTNIGAILARPSAKLPKRLAWLNDAHADLFAAELQNLPYLSVVASGKTAPRLPTGAVKPEWVKQASSSHEDAPLVFGLTPTVAGKNVKLTVKVYERISGRAVFTATEMAEPNDLSKATHALASRVAEGLLPALAKNATFRASLSDPKALQAPKAEKLVARLRLQKADVFNIFPAQLAHYRDNPAGKIVLKHDDPKAPAATDVRVSIHIPKLMALPSEVNVPRIDPGAQREIPVHLTFDVDRLLAIEENTPAQAEVRVEYDVGDGHQTERRVVPLMIYAKNAIDWSDDTAIAAFVTPREKTVRALARKALAAKTDVEVPDSVRSAVLIHSALRQLKLGYVKDPALPSRTHELDNVQFARESLSHRSGDCDDLSVLYASLLESVGVETGFVMVPGHILPAFAVGSSESALTRVSFDPARSFQADGRYWIPVEATLVDASFEKAWANGAEDVARWKKKGEMTFVRTRDAWTVYPPAPLPAQDQPVRLDDAGLRKVANEALARVIAERDQGLQKRLGAFAKASGKNGNISGLNEHAQLLARAGRLTDAKSKLDAAVKKAPKISAIRVNLGNVLVLTGKSTPAIEQYQLAIETGQGGQGAIHNNMGLAYYVAGDAKNAALAFEDAVAMGAGDLLAALGMSPLDAVGKRRAAGKSTGSNSVLETELKSVLLQALIKVKKKGKLQKRADSRRYDNPLPSGGRRGDDPLSKKRLIDLLAWQDIEEGAN